MKFKVLLRKRGGARARACGRRARSCKHNDVGKLCIKYTVGSKHGTRARSILSVPCKRVARAGEGARVRVGGGARCRNAAPRSGAQCSVVARVSTQPHPPLAELTRDNTTQSSPPLIAAVAARLAGQPPAVGEALEPSVLHHLGGNAHGGEVRHHLLGREVADEALALAIAGEGGDG